MNEKERKNKQNNYDRLKVSKSMINVHIYIYNIYNNILYRYTLPNTNSTIINITTPNSKAAEIFVNDFVKGNDV